jgi:hypothetical protein
MEGIHITPSADEIEFSGILENFFLPYCTIALNSTMPSQIQLLRYRYLIFVDSYSYASNNQITVTVTLNVSQSINSSSKLLAYVYTFSSPLNGTNFLSFSSLVGFHLKSTGSNLYDVGV